MERLGDLVARGRRADHPALVVPDAGRSLTYREFCTTAWKAGNFLRHLGVAADHGVVVAADPVPEPLLTFMGAAQLGATTRFLPTDAVSEPAALGDARAVVVDHEREHDVDVPDGTTLSVYGGEPTSPTTTHWEGQVWSENPSFPPTDVGPETVALAVDGDEYTHADLLDAATDVVTDLDVGSDGEVVVGASLREPGAVVGVVAALRVGASATLTGESRGVLRSDSGMVDTASVLDG